MFKKLFQKFSALYNKQIDAKGLAIFRIAFSLVFLGEVIQLAYFQHLIFDKIPYLVPGEIKTWPLFIFWIASIVFIIFGLFTRAAAAVNYIFTVVVMGTMSTFEYHMFYSYLIINFLFIFVPVSQTLSLDRLLLKLKYSNNGERFVPAQTVSALSYYIPVLLGVGFIYFDSVFFKFSTHIWLSGLGLWLPGSLPEAVIFDNSYLLNLKYVVIALGYITLLFETIFLFVFWRKKWMVSIMILGVGLHIGILIFFPIPFFALGIVAVYILMVPVSFWNKFFKPKRASQKLFKFYYDDSSLFCNQITTAIDHFDSNKHIEFLPVQHSADKELAFTDVKWDDLFDGIYSVDRRGRIHKGFDSFIRALNVIWYLKLLSWILRLPGIYRITRRIYKYIAINRAAEQHPVINYNTISPSLTGDGSTGVILTNLSLRQLKVNCVFWGLIFFSILQIIVTYNSPLSKIFREKIGISNLKVVKISESISNAVNEVSKVFFGISHHGVFVDSHFVGYNHDIAIVYVSPDGTERWLPIIDKSGMPGAYLVGPVWAKWTFRVDGPLVNQTKLTTGLRDFTAFWAFKNGVSLKNAVFEIKVKKNREPKQWEYDFLNKQLQNPWLDAGKVTWSNDIFYPSIKVIEEM